MRKFCTELKIVHKKFKTNIHLTKGDFKFINPLENKYKIENGANIIVDNGISNA